MVRQRVRIQFSKKGRLRFIGHRDLLRALERLFRRARLPLAMSQGFHPKVRMSFPSALALGVAGEAEVMELELDEAISADKLLAKLNAHAMEGLHFHAAELLPPGEKKARLAGSVFELIVPPALRETTSRRIEELLHQEEIRVARPSGKEVDLRKAVRSLTLEAGGRLRMDLISTQGADASYREVLAFLELDSLTEQGIAPARTRVRLASPRTGASETGSAETSDPL
jgi:radical SAM-linked protein